MPYPSLGPQPQGGMAMGQGRGGRPMLARPSLDPGRGPGMAVRPEWTGHDASLPRGLPPGPPFMPPPRAQYSMPPPRPIYHPPPMWAREGPGNGAEGSGAGRPAPPLPQLRPDAPGFPAPPSMRPQELSLSQLVLNLRTTLHEISVQRETHQRRVAQLTVLPRPYDPAWNRELEREVMGVRAMDDAYARCEARIRQLEPRPQVVLPPSQQANSGSVRQREDEWLETVERSMARRRDDAQHMEAQSTQPLADTTLEARRQRQATGGDGSTGSAPPPSPASVPHAPPRPGTLRPSAPAFAFTPRQEMSTQLQQATPQPSPATDPNQAAETKTADEPKEATQVQAPEPPSKAPPPPTPQEPPAPPPSLGPSMAQQAPSSAPVLMVGCLVLDDEVGDDDSIEALLREACLPPSSPQSPLPRHTTSPAPLSPQPVPPASTEDEASATLIFPTPPPHTGPSPAPAPPSLPPGLVMEAAPPVAQADQAPISVRNHYSQRGL
jgi:hypothetical protein